MHRETCTVLMGCSKGSAVRLAPSSLLCAQTGRAWDWDCARGPVAARVGLGLCARASGRRGARAWDCARVGRWALLLVVVTRSCAAGPDRWQCGRPAWTTTCGVNLRSEGAQASTCPGMCAWAGGYARALLLVVVTPSCAAGPFWWQCGRPAWATTCGVNLRSEGAQASTCPADPATPRRSHPSPSHLSVASGTYPSNTTCPIARIRVCSDSRANVRGDA